MSSSKPTALRRPPTPSTAPSPRGGPARELLLSGWGGTQAERCRVYRPDARQAVIDQVRDRSEGTRIARGLGRAYGDPAVNGDGAVVELSRLDRFLAFDERQAVLWVEAGVALGEILRVFVPRGYSLPVVPGTQWVTVGGAIAADVHGKNHHVDGSFGLWVDALELLLASGEVLWISPTLRPELYWATVGGMGLTGIILSARLRLRAIESAHYRVAYRRSRDLDATLSALADSDADHRYSVAWIDCLAGGRGLGRSVLMLANDSPAAALPPAFARRALQLRAGRQAAVPTELPNLALNSLTVGGFNAVYYAAHPDRERWVDLEGFFFPLDRVRHWNRIYGRRGFVQYQALLPKETSARALVTLLEAVVGSQRASFLAVLKTSGAANPAPLSFLYPGHTLALDLPFTPDLPALTRRLDRVLLDHGGRLYLAKDALTDAGTLASMYPRLHEWQAIKHRLDPERRFVSSQARRLGLVPA